MTPLSAEEERTLAEVVRRIVAVADPERIVLFGSRARGDARPDSDFDLLVVAKGPCHRRRTAQRIYRALSGAGAAVDLVVVVPDDIVRYGHSPALVIEPALRDGRVVYGG